MQDETAVKGFWQVEAERHENEIIHLNEDIARYRAGLEHIDEMLSLAEVQGYNYLTLLGSLKRVQRLVRDILNKGGKS